MALTHDEIRNLLRQNLHKDTGFSDPGDLNILLNLGKERIVQDSPDTLGVKTQSITTVASQQENDLASDFWQARGVWDATSGTHLGSYMDSEWITNVERLPTIPEGPPLYYNITVFDAATAIWKIRWNPTPDDIRTIKVFYWWVPATITGSGTALHCSLGFSELLLWAATLIGRSRNDPEGAQEAERQYKELLVEYKAYNPQGPDSNSILQSHMATDGGGSTLRLPPQYPSS